MKGTTSSTRPEPAPSEREALVFDAILPRLPVTVLPLRVCQGTGA